MIRVLTLVGCVVILGCGSSGPPTVPVSGKVQFADGKPVPYGIVEFLPLGGGPAARGKIEADGRFTLTTGTQDGAVVGTHRVSVTQLFAAHPGMKNHKHPGPTVDRKYAQPDTSGLTKDVRAEGSNEIQIEVTGAP